MQNEPLPGSGVPQQPVPPEQPLAPLPSAPLVQAAQQQPAQPAPPQVSQNALPQTQPAPGAPDPLLAEPAAFGEDGPVAPVVVDRLAPKSYKWLWIVLGIVVALALAGGGYWFGVGKKVDVKTDGAQKSSTTTKNPVQTKPDGEATKTEALQLDTSKKYGNKYADGLLPVGDSKYTTDAPKKGYVYTCSQYAQSLTADKGGAGTRGPWFTNNNTQYDLSKKAHVLGSVHWTPSFSNTVGGSIRTIATNDLPSHVTGVYPIGASDPAYVYDRNPNRISAQTLSYQLSASPTYTATPRCMGGEVGVMLTGVALFNAFDAGGRDAGAWEVQDDCGGHPQKDGEYHYHTLSSCITDVGVTTVIGYALDGFPITGPKLGADNILTTADLDECHGITSAITVDGKVTTTYHYVMTQDFPYSVSCFRSTAANPPGMPESGPPQGH